MICERSLCSITDFNLIYTFCVPLISRSLLDKSEAIAGTLWLVLMDIPYVLAVEIKVWGLMHAYSRRTSIYVAFLLLSRSCNFQQSCISPTKNTRRRILAISLHS